MTPKIASFAGENYLNLRTYRKSGETVPTPVWFVQEGETLYVRTGAESGKVRRLTRSPHVDVAPCDYSGKLHTDWLPAEAHVVKGEIDKHVNWLLRRKYGFQKTLFDWLGSLQRADTATVEIHLN
jgi:PPOX class probable F420-dependent enzyme